MKFITSLLGRFFVSGVALILGLGLLCLFGVVVAPVLLVAVVGWKLAIAALL